MLGDQYDAVVIGGGFYGCCLALHLRRDLGLARVAVVERENRLLGRASYSNQARVHGGYHYPREFTTAYRSRMNFDRFTTLYREAVVDDFVKLYAVTRRGSRITARQFERSMSAIGAPMKPASRRHTALFSGALVEAVYETQEYAFDALRLARMISSDLDDAGVHVILETEALVDARRADGVLLRLEGKEESSSAVARCVFNCTYGRLAHVPGIPAPRAGLKYQVTEMCLVDVPRELKNIGVTVMDGPFFSCMPFPSRGLHSLSHVRYTPRLSWLGTEIPDRDPYAFLKTWNHDSAFAIMVRDSARYLPLLSRAEHKDSLIEIKVLLVANDSDDGRPILVEGEPAPGQVVSLLGGKLDNIFDVLSAIDERERLTT